MPETAVFVVGVLGLGAGMAAALFMDALRWFARRAFTRMQDEDFLWWSVIVAGSVAALAALPQAMSRYCEPGFTCRLLP